MPTDEFLTLEQLAELLQVPTQTIRRWRRYHTGPASYRIGKHIRYRRADVEAWLKTKAVA